MTNILQDDRIGTFLTIAISMILIGSILGIQLIVDTGATMFTIFAVCFWYLWLWGKYVQGGA